MKIHIVQKGDTLWKIAQKYGVQFEELKKINSQLSNPDMIMPGMKIKIPGTSTAKQTQMMPSNTKINVGSKKEAPISGTTVSPVKEVPKQVAVTPMNVAPLPTQQVPNIHKEQPMTVKEQPMVQPMPVMPQPIIPEVDINNYYIANMSNMMVQKPQPKEQPKEYPKEQPIVLKPEESPESMESNVQQPMHSYPVMVDNCVPFTPIMPGPGFCQPMYPTMYQQPVYGPGPVQMQMQMHQPYYGEESTSMFEPQMSSWHYGAYMPMMQHQSMMPQYGHMYYEPGIVIPQVPLVSAHGLHHHIESTSHYVSESSSHMQAPYDQYQSAMPEQVMEEEDCGCGAPKMPKTMDESMNEGQHVQQFMSFQPQLATSNQVQMDPTHMSESHAEMNDSQMSGSQPNMYQSQMSGSQPGMYQPQMSGGQPGMHQPQMSGGQPGMYQPQMSGGQPGMYQPQMSGGQPGMAQQQMNPNQPGSMMPQMRGNQPFIPMGNVPFYGQDENIPDIGKLSSYSEAFELPRFADESNE